MVPSLVKWYGTYNDYDYSELTSEEKQYLDFYDSCLFGSSENIRYASSKMQMLILECLARLNTENEMTTEEINAKKEEIYKDLTFEEQDIVNTFGYACSQVIGIFSEERKSERKLLKRGNNKYE